MKVLWLQLKAIKLIQVRVKFFAKHDWDAETFTDSMYQGQCSKYRLVTG